jgi:transcriptional regulator with XRE-family HTH domain
MTDVSVRSGVGPLLRDWRRRRRRSQLDLALDAGVSARHVSFVESGRSRPSAEMVVRLAEQLEVPLRDRNELLLAAGYAPLYGERPLDDPDMTPVRDALELVLRGHEPYPAAVVDRWWEMVAANSGIALLTEGVAPELLEPPVNVMRVALHPDGMAPRIVNFAEWSGHLMHRLQRRTAITGDAELARLHAELAGYPGVQCEPPRSDTAAEIALPLRLRRGRDELTFLCTQTTFGTAVDVTLAELSLEAFYPADSTTARVLDELRTTAPP